MSTTTSTSVQHKSTKLSTANGRTDLQFTDDILNSLSKDILPPQPFLISVPTNTPFRQPSRLEGVWRTGTPFNFDEEQLQYLSFHSHQEEDTLLLAHGGWSDERGNILREEAQKQDILRSATNTPSVGPQKRKKITLGEYKKKGEAKDAAPNQEVSASQEANMAVAAVKAHHPEIKKPDTNRVMQSKKRSIEELEPTMPSAAASANTSKDNVGPIKKARMTSPPRQSHKETSKLQGTAKKIPKLLSPNLSPATIERKLPRLLSPTLPPGLEEMFAKRFPNETPITPKKGASNQPSQSESQTSLAEKSKDKHPLNLSLQRDRSDSQNSTKSATSVPRSDHERKGKPSPSIVAAKDLQKIRQQQHEAQPSPRLKRIVVLKYGKRNSRTVLRLLKLAPKRKPTPTPERDHARQEDKPTEKSTDRRPVEVRKEKRPLPDTKEGPPGPPLKRPKLPPSLDSGEKPRTPVPQAFRSPLLQNSISFPLLFTPKKAPKSIAMQRVESSEGDVRTPEGIVRSPRATYRNTTPLPVEPPRSATSSPSTTHQEDSKSLASKQSHTSRPSSSTNQQPTSHLSNGNTARSRENIHRAWRSQRDKYFQIGRSIKRAAQQLVPRGSSPSSNSTDTKRSSVLYIEGLLAFMLNLAVNSKTTLADWRSIMDYWAFVRSALQHQPDLRGLCLHLGTVCMGAIQRQDMERMEKTPVPSGNDVTVASAPTPGSDGQARLEGSSGEADHRAKERYANMVTDITANFKRLERTAAEAEELLPWSIFRERFRGTWKRGIASSKVEVKRAEAEPENIQEGKFTLPIGPGSSGFEAVGFGMACLREWCETQGVTWKSEIAEAWS